MRTILRFVLHRTVLVNLVFILFMVAGAFSLLNVPVERYPNVNMGKVYVEVFFPGATPEEVEALVTREIEDALDDLPNMEFIRATSYRQRSLVVVKFLDDVDYQAGYDELRLRVLGVMDELPPEVDPPLFNSIDVNDWLPVMSINLVGDRSNRALTLMAKELKIPLRRINGVKEIKIQGEQVREFHVFLNPDRLTAYGITFDQVAKALGQAGVGVPAGDFSGPGGEFVVQADERFRSRSQVLDTIVRTDSDGSFVRLSDLADGARLEYRDPYILSSVNGRDCVTLQVIKTPQGNALEIADAVRALLKRFVPRMKQEGVSLVVTRDSTTFIDQSLLTLGSNMLLGVLLVWVVIWYFMGLRNAVITTVGIPFSFLFTMVIMYLTGNSLNEITLFSFVLVSGIIVDDAIVVVENIYRHLQEGQDLDRAIVDGTSEVALPVVAATATTVAAFLPMLIMSGSTGEFFSLVPKAVSFALVASLFECIFILPLHFKDWGPKNTKKAFDTHDEEFTHEPRLMAWIRAGVFKLLPLCMRFRWSSLGLALAAFAVAVFIAAVSFTGRIPLIKVKFFPDDYSLYYVIVEGSVGMPIEKTARLLEEIEKDVMADGPGMAKSAKGYAGFYPSEDYEPTYGFNAGHVAVTLPVRDKRKFADYPVNNPEAHLERMRKRLSAKYAPQGLRIRVRPEKDGPPAGKDVNIRLVGTNPKSVRGLARDTMAFLKGNAALRGALTDLSDGAGTPNRVWRFKVNREKAAEYHLTPRQVVSLAAAAMGGRYVGKYRLQDEEVDLKLMLDPASVADPSKALALPLVEHPSGPVRLGDLTKVSTFLDSGQLDRYQGERAVTITANLRPGAPTSLPQVVDLVERHYQKVADSYPGATLTFGGEFESTRKSFSSLAWAFVIAVMLIYMILATQFSSYLQPFVIMSAVIFALTGMILGKFLTQSLFTVNSFIATVGVTGVVVNDALVLIDFLNKRYATGVTRKEAVRQAVHMRLRPILLTTVTTTLGLLPMALGIPYYSIVWGTMASTFVTGLCTATFLTVLLVPVQWDLLQGLKERLAARKLRKSSA